MNKVGTSPALMSWHSNEKAKTNPSKQMIGCHQPFLSMLACFLFGSFSPVSPARIQGRDGDAGPTGTLAQDLAHSGWVSLH